MQFPAMITIRVITMLAQLFNWRKTVLKVCVNLLTMLIEVTLRSNMFAATVKYSYWHAIVNRLPGTIS